MAEGARSPAYAPLSAYLLQQTACQLLLSFPAIEAILGMALPPAAWTPPFWSNHLAARVPTVTFVWAPMAASSWQPPDS
jgi:hypothetical protein